MAKGLHTTNVTEFNRGVHLDNNPVKQPKGTRRFTLNAVEESTDGQQYSISNEKGNIDVTTFPAGFYPIGDRYIEDDVSVVILVNPTTNSEEIGLITKDDVYTALVQTKVLSLKITNQCDITYRLRRGNERVIYWVDGLNRARTLNLDRLHNFYNNTYQAYLKSGGNPTTFVGEKWDASSFDLIKSYSSIPFFSGVQIIESGSILPGSYNFAIQYVDEDLNPTEWITTSNPVRIFNDSVANPFQRIRGSRNTQNSAQDFSRANKSIKLTITNLDEDFPYYRVAIIRAAGNTGEPEKVLASDLYPTTDSNFVYSGNDSSLTEVNLADILIDREVIYAPDHIEQLENRLIVANTQGKGINWCDFQKYASKISSNLATKQVLLNNINSDPNIKNAKSTFLYRGYMPGEVYSFGICYVLSDGYISPVFHIPGKNSADTTSLMKHHQLSTKYVDVHNCTTNYWGVDAKNQSLVGKNVRHHRFPFRKEINKPLITKTGTTTTNITKYRLKLVFSLNPAYTPGPNTYPTATDGSPLVIGYTMNYQPTGAGSTSNFNGQLVDTDITSGAEITIYDDTVALDIMSGAIHYAIDPASPLAAYMTGTNDRFIITETYESYVLSSTTDNDVSEILGINFSNIQKPHPDVIGFYIVRNERTEDDRLVVDTALFGVMTQHQQYKSFGLINPKQFYNFANCGINLNPYKNLGYFNKGVWFFNPEFQYFHKKLEYDSIEVEGKYTQDSVNLPLTCNDDRIGLAGATKGVYINDVQAGTSYNPEVHKKKNKDDDGFDLVIGYRNVNVNFAIDSTYVFPVKDRTIYLNATAYQNYSGNTYYNVSIDNKIGMHLTGATFNTDDWYNPGDQKNTLRYGALIKDNTTSYSNFINRPYYKEHNNPVLFGNNNTVNNFEVFNGDVDISAFNFVSSVFYDMVVADRPKKSKLWKIIVGVLLVVAAVVATVATGGAAAPLAVVAASSLAVSYGVTLLVSGIKFEQMKQMVDVDYEKGLKETVYDGGVCNTVSDVLGKKDDTIRWFADRVSNIYMESQIPFGLRCGLTTGVSDFVDAPDTFNDEGFRTYLTEKMTVIDREQGSGRLYKGYAGAEVYDINKDYMRFNKEKRFSHLPIEYDCCSDSKETFPTRIWWSEQSFQEERIDNYRVFLPNNYRDIEGEHGEITDLYRLGSALFIHTKEGLWHLPQSSQERVTGEIISFIGTGQFFSLPPRKVIDDSLGSGGSKHKWATIKTRHGVFFINEVESKVYLHSDKPQDLSVLGMRNYFENNLKPFLSSQLFYKFKVDFLHTNNPANPNGIGYLGNYDTRYNRIIFTKKDYSILPDKLAILKLVNVVPTGGTDFTYCTANGLFYLGATQINLNNGDYFENKSFTLSFSLHTNRWVGWHSYLPNYYIFSQNNFYSFINGSNKVWKHNQEGIHHTFYGTYYPHIVELVSLSNPLQDKTFEDLTLHTKARKWDANSKQYFEERFITFTKVIISNSKQCSGELEMVVKDTQANPQNWYQQQIVNTPGQILISREETNWNVNEFRDNLTDYSKPMFTSLWSAIRNKYPIDKVVDVSIIDFNKNWNELEPFRDKFIVIRLIFDGPSDINLVTDYSLETEQPSIK